MRLAGRGAFNQFVDNRRIPMRAVKRRCQSPHPKVASASWAYVLCAPLKRIAAGVLAVERVATSVAYKFNNLQLVQTS